MNSSSIFKKLLGFVSLVLQAVHWKRLLKRAPRWLLDSGEGLSVKSKPLIGEPSSFDQVADRVAKKSQSRKCGLSITVLHVHCLCPKCHLPAPKSRKPGFAITSCSQRDLLGNERTRPEVFFISPPQALACGSGLVRAFLRRGLLGQQEAKGTCQTVGGTWCCRPSR